MVTTLRVRVKSIVLDGMNKIILEWIEVHNDGKGNSEVSGEVKHTEEYQFPVNSGVSYISKMEVNSSNLRKGTFWQDRIGRRHFIIDAEPVNIGLKAEGIGN